MIILDVVDARVRKCKDVNIIIDKKMRERKIIYEKYIIPLEQTHPFEIGEFVKILRKEDFEKIGNILKSVKTEKAQFKKEIENLNYLIDRQKDYIIKLEKLQNNESKNKDNGYTLRELLGF